MATRRVSKPRCPKCGGEIVYNGNYFCEHWNYPVRYEDQCDWALPHPQVTDEDKKISIALTGHWEEETFKNGEAFVIQHEEFI